MDVSIFTILKTSIYSGRKKCALLNRHSSSSTIFSIYTLFFFMLTILAPTRFCIFDIHLNPLAAINTLNIFDFPYIKIILQIVYNILAGFPHLCKHWFIIYIIRKTGCAPGKPVKSVKIKSFNFVTKYHLLHKKKNGIYTWKARKINDYQWFYFLAFLINTWKYYIHNKKNRICTEKARKFNKNH